MMAKNTTMVALLVLLLYLTLSVESNKILIACSQYGSHLNELHAMGEELIHRGHQVSTIIFTHFAQAYRDSLQQKGFDVIEFHLSPDEPTLHDQGWQDMLNKAIFEGTQKTVFRSLERAMNCSMRDCRHILDNETFMHGLKDSNFDMVLIDGFEMAPCNALLPHVLNVTFISSFTFLLPWVGHFASYPSIEPFIISEFSEKMSFSERLQNFVYFVMFATFGFGEFQSRHLELLNKYAPEITTWGELRRSASLHIITRDHTLDYILPTMPHYVKLPGITYKPPDPLPVQIKQIADESQDGIIVFTMGSSLRTFPPAIFDKFMHVFSRLPQTVFMAQSGSIKDVDVPKNVHLLPWVPQNSLLGHKNTKLFITHCGNNGHFEAVYHGVPMLGFPVFGEQHYNAARLAYKKVGIKLSLVHFETEELFDAINELVNNTIYKENIQKMSYILRDRPLTARQEAAYWIEHVIKFGGKHLRSHALDMPTYQFFVLDIIALILVVFTALVSLLYVCIKRLIKALTTLYHTESRNIKED